MIDTTYQTPEAALVRKAIEAGYALRFSPGCSQKLGREVLDAAFGFIDATYEDAAMWRQVTAQLAAFFTDLLKVLRSWMDTDDCDDVQLTDVIRTLAAVRENARLADDAEDDIN